MKGFGQPRYWLQIVYCDDTPDKWIPLKTGSTRKSRDRAALATQNPNVDYVLRLHGSVQEGAIAEHDDILDEFQSYDVPGGRRYKLTERGVGRKQR